MRARPSLFLLALLTVSCDESAPLDAGADGAIACAAPEAFEVGDADGHAEPLGASAGEARAGRVSAADLPPFPSGLEVWEEGDFVLANDRVAMVIEDAGESELYDPWGGRPVGIARVEDGRLVEPGDFGEILLLLGRMSVLTERVSVIADGADGGPAIIRAEGTPRPTPFFESVVGSVIAADFSAMRVAIDYELAPDSDHVDVYFTIRSGEARIVRALTTMHAFMHTPRMPPFAPGVGYDVAGAGPWVGFADPRGTGFAYFAPGEELEGGLEISGFVSFFSRPLAVGCGELRRHHARIVLGGPDVSGLYAAVLRSQGVASRVLEGEVRDEAGAIVAGASVIAEDAAGFVTRGVTDVDGHFALTVAEDAEVTLTVFRPGARPVGPMAPAATITVPTLGTIRVRVVEPTGDPLPARVALIAEDLDAFAPPSAWGLPREGRGRTRVVFPTDGEVELPVEAGTWRVIAARGYEYTAADESVSVAAGGLVEVVAALARVVDTDGVQCGDFHIHTHRSNDSGDDARLKVRSAVGDGVEIPVRSDHEYVVDFQPIVEELGLDAWAFGMASVEMTSFESWGHMGVVPLVPDEAALNGGAPRWQRYPTNEDPDAPVETLSPVEVFEAARARPEAPVIIINHPRGSTNYFGYVGYDPVTGTVAREADWDEDFGLVEIFNDQDWRSAFDGTVRDWLSFLDRGRRVFAVGSSDSHGIDGSPVGYPRTCLALGTDDPRELTPVRVRDALAAGAATISGGVYVDASVGDVGPGGDATGLGDRASVSVRVQAASWVDVDRIDVVVDGAVLEQLDIPADPPDPLVPTTRFDDVIEVPVATGGSYVIIAAYGDQTLEPVHPGRIPFGVTNPIFLSR